MKNFVYVCTQKLRKECKLLEMSVGYSLLIVIGYDLVSYLLHYPSAHCVTFKELFVCKSSYLIRDFEIKSRIFYSRIH